MTYVTATAHTTPKTPNNPHIDSAKTDETGFWRFWHYATGHILGTFQQQPKDQPASISHIAQQHPREITIHNLVLTRRVLSVEGG